MERIKKVLERALRNLGIEKKVKEGRVFEVWDKAVGKKIGAHAHPLKIKRGKLFVKVTDSSWLQELSFLKEKIIKKVNKGLGEEVVKEIFFR